MKIFIPFLLSLLWGALLAGSEPIRVEGSDTIDATVVLQIGPTEISQYVLDGNFARAFGKGPSSRKPSASEARRWLERYLVQQLATAKALSLGYAQRPEVIQAVELMERHMLSSLAGPLYRALASETPQPGETVRTGERRSGTEIRARIITQHRRDVLHDAQFEARPAVAERIIVRLQTSPDRLANIPEASLAPFLADVLAVYQDGGTSVRVTVRDWCTYYNQLYVRRFPTTASALVIQLEDMAIVTFDVREARRRQIDRTPKFQEDRRDFIHRQALDLFEKEKLLPQITVSDADLQDYYRRNAASYAQVMQASGFLLEFPSEEAAGTWLRQNPPPWTQLPREALPAGSAERLVSAASPLPGLEPATEIILRMPDATPFGPVLAGGRWLVFVRRSTLKSSPLLPEIAVQVRAGLLRERLDALEQSLARETAGSFEIKDAIDYTRYGLTAAMVAPWAQPGSGAPEK